MNREAEESSDAVGSVTSRERQEAELEVAEIKILNFSLRMDGIRGTAVDVRYFQR